LLNRSIGKLFEINFVNAAAWLLPKETIKKVGGFDPLFTHWGEDNNYIDRLKYQKLKIGVCSCVRIYHDRGDALTDRNKFFKEYYYRTKLRALLDPASDTNFDCTKRELLHELFRSLKNRNFSKFKQVGKAIYKLHKKRKIIENRIYEYSKSYCFIEDFSE
jgi:GT2 family glycosyltransferase